MADKLYVLSVPDPDTNFGLFHELDPKTEAEAREYLATWYTEPKLSLAFRLFAAEVTEEPLDPPRYEHDCDRCVYAGRFGEYDAYFCPDGDDLRKYDSVVLRHGDDGPAYKSRPRHIHALDPEGFPEAAHYTAVFEEHPRKCPRQVKP